MDATGWAFSATAPGPPVKIRPTALKARNAYPYKYQVWGYDANELVAVKQGTKQPWEPRPYALWNFTLPFEQANDSHALGGAA